MDTSSIQDHVDPTLDEDATSPAAEILRLWKHKQPAEPPLAPERGPLTLLKLPVDILRLILNEISNDSRGDLLQLLAVNSTLHNLAASYIYSSFDIVWPDDSDLFPSIGVDALTHGLSTFALGNRFARTIHRLHGLKRPRHEELRNNYPLFTRSFSMANGPSKWVSDSVVTTEYGKMLNTLVAIAIQRMSNLESFKWDMPTGLSSDVFMALASLDDQPDDHPCKLERVWVRWHDSRSTDASSSTSGEFIDDPLMQPPPPVPFAPEQPPSPPSSTAESIGSLIPNPSLLPRRRVPYSENEVEYPTFSVLPSLKSITALEIDQLAYLDELSILVERSKPLLKELRLSVATKVRDEDFVQVKGDQHNLQQVDLDARWPGESIIGSRRLGGVLGVVFGRIYDLRKHWPRLPNDGPEMDSSPADLPSPGPAVPTASGGLVESPDPDLATESLNSFDAAQIEDHSLEAPMDDSKSISLDVPGMKRNPLNPQEEAGESDDKLALELLELARIPIHVRLCANALDWTVLTSLTILQCPGQEKLWRALREQYRPTLVNTRPRRSSNKQLPRETWQYHLRLRNIHVDVTTFSLMNFLKETLAPNSLEVLFLHDRRRSAVPPVPFRHIFTGPIKRQHSSLKKLLLDSTHIDKVNSMGDARRMSWALSLEMIHYITSGKMNNLRELSASIDTSDLHSLLQRLPMMTNLTSLDIPSMGRGIGTVSSEEVGLQIVDVIALRPEIKLRFLGIRNVRYEIVETRRGSPGSDAESTVSDDAFSLSVSSGSHPPFSDVAVDDEDAILPSDNESDLESHASRRATPDDASPRGHETEMATIYQLREIFAYDDKVAIFKAKQGKL